MSGSRRFAASVGEKSHYFADGFTAHVRGWEVGVQVRALRGDGKYAGPSKDQDSVRFDIDLTGGSNDRPLEESHIASVAYDKATGKRKVTVKVWTVMLKADDGTFSIVDIASSLKSAKAKWVSHCPGEYKYYYNSETEQYEVVGANDVLYGILTKVLAD